MSPRSGYRFLDEDDEGLEHRSAIAYRVGSILKYQSVRYSIYVRILRRRVTVRNEDPNEVKTASGLAAVRRRPAVP